MSAAGPEPTSIFQEPALTHWLIARRQTWKACTDMNHLGTEAHHMQVPGQGGCAGRSKQISRTHSSPSCLDFKTLETMLLLPSWRTQLEMEKKSSKRRPFIEPSPAELGDPGYSELHKCVFYPQNWPVHLCACVGILFEIKYSNIR